MVRDRYFNDGKLLVHYKIAEPAMDDVFLNFYKAAKIFFL